jgi:hypothetical protein
MSTSDEHMSLLTENNPGRQRTVISTSCPILLGNIGGTAENQPPSSFWTEVFYFRKYFSRDKG